MTLAKFKCATCGHRFPTKGHLQRHMAKFKHGHGIKRKASRRAMDIELWECTDCGEEFPRAMELLQHQAKTKHGNFMRYREEISMAPEPNPEKERRGEGEAEPGRQLIKTI